MAENFSTENSNPIINNKNITPNSESVEIMLVLLMVCPITIPVMNKPIIDGNFNLLKIKRTITAVINITDICCNKVISIFAP